MLFLIQVHSAETWIILSEVFQVLCEFIPCMPDFLIKHFEDGPWPEGAPTPTRLKLEEVLDIN